MGHERRKVEVVTEYLNARDSGGTLRDSGFGALM